MRSTHGIKSVVFVVTLAYLHYLVRGDAEVTCVVMESCILPCKFQAGSDILIRWIRKPSVNIYVHSYYDDEDQFKDQDQHFSNRTSLFNEQISKGNASLRLTRVETEDQGGYECRTSVSDEPDIKISVINLKVEDAVPVTPTSVLLSSAQPNPPTQVDGTQGDSDNNENIKIIIGVVSGILVAVIGGLTGFCLHRRGICRSGETPQNPPAREPEIEMREILNGGEQGASPNDETARLNNE